MLKTHVDVKKHEFLNRRLKKSIPLIYQLTYTAYSMYINIVCT